MKPLSRRTGGAAAFFLSLLLLLTAVLQHAHALQVPPLTGRVNDLAGILSPASTEMLTRNLEALHLTACAHRLRGEPKLAKSTLRRILEMDPLHHGARFELYLLGSRSPTDFHQQNRNEFPTETNLEFATW